MASPKITVTIRDPGLGLVRAADNKFIFFGCSNKGTVNTIVPVTTPAGVEDAFGDGPLAEALAYALSVAGGPQWGCRLTGTTAGAAGAVTPTRVGTSTGTITVAGAAYDSYEVVVEIMATGAAGVGTFRYSLDNGDTWSATLTIPSGGTYVISRTNLTLTFVPGGGPVLFERGDKHAFATTAPHYSSTELALGMDAILPFVSLQPDIDIDAVVFTGKNATGSGAATLFGALGVKLDGLAPFYRYLQAMMDLGSGDTRGNVKTAFAAVAHKFISGWWGELDLATAKGFPGWGAPRQLALNAAAGIAARELCSTDLAYFGLGPIPGATKLYYDEFVSAELDDAKISTLRTWPGASGFYINNARLKSPTGSDFEYWQEGRIVNIAARETVKGQMPFMSSGFDTNANGTIEETEALTVEAGVKDRLRAQLLDPKRVNGKKGHVSALNFTVDRTTNYALTRVVYSKTAVRPLQYAKEFVTEIGFALNVGA